MPSDYKELWNELYWEKHSELVEKYVGMGLTEHHAGLIAEKQAGEYAQSESYERYAAAADFARKAQKEGN